MDTEQDAFPIDHVELPVHDRYEAAEWYEKELGFEINRDYEHWAEAGGPLLVSPDGGSTHLALVTGQGGPGDEASPGHIALRVAGERFLDLIDELKGRDVLSASGSTVTRDDILDRDGAYAVMIQDPYGNRFELITYDTEAISSLP